MRKLAPVVGSVMAVVLAWGAACAPVRVPLISTGPLSDLVRIPQDATIFSESGDRPILEADEAWIEKFEAYWYGPWERTEPEVCGAESFGWAAESFAGKPVFGPNLLRLSASQVKAVVANARLDEFPSRAEYGIAIRNTSLRALPSAEPFYFDFRKAGEGYPFDYNQNSAVWAGTPLFLTHVSKDGRFVGAESPYTCGWIDARDVAAVDEEFMAAYRRPRLAALRRDRIPISGDPGGFLFEGRVGMLLPMADGAEAGGVRLLAPVADEGRRASLSQVRVADQDAAPIPFPFSQARLAELINQIMGQPYGWGGLGGHRDCSSTVLDIFLPFGLPLPRNSRSQAGAGKKVDLSDLSTEDKTKADSGNGGPLPHAAEHSGPCHALPWSLPGIPGGVSHHLGTADGFQRRVDLGAVSDREIGHHQPVAGTRDSDVVTQQGRSAGPHRLVYAAGRRVGAGFPGVRWRLKTRGMGKGSSSRAASIADEEIPQHIQSAFDPPHAVAEISDLVVHTLAQVVNFSAQPTCFLSQLLSHGTDGSVQVEESQNENRRSDPLGQFRCHQFLVKTSIDSLTMPGRE